MSPNPQIPKSPNHYPLSTIHYPLFSVRTPTALVTDLGTEFGVEVDRQGMTSTLVFVGTVRLAAVGEENGAGEVIGAGQAGSVRRGERRVVVTEAKQDDAAARRFVRSMPPPKSVRQSEAYAKFVLSLNPAVYYRMERPSETGGEERGTRGGGEEQPPSPAGSGEGGEGGPEKVRDVVLDSAPGGHHGELRLGAESSGSPYAAGRFGAALRLRGPRPPSSDETGDHIIVPDYPKTTDNRLTVVAWVTAFSRPAWAQIANNWSVPEKGWDFFPGQFHLGLYFRDGDLSAEVTQANKRIVGVREGAASPFPLNGWQHVALVADGEVLRLYRNAEEVDSRPCKGVVSYPVPVLEGLGVGCRTNAAGTRAFSSPTSRFWHSFYWHGMIDELAVFNRALSVETIKRLYFNKPPDPSKQGKTDYEQSSGVVNR